MASRVFRTAVWALLSMGCAPRRVVFETAQLEQETQSGGLAPAAPVAARLLAGLRSPAEVLPSAEGWRCAPQSRDGIIRRCVGKSGDCIIDVQRGEVVRFSASIARLPRMEACAQFRMLENAISVKVARSAPDQSGCVCPGSSCRETSSDSEQLSAWDGANATLGLFLTRSSDAPSTFALFILVETEEAASPMLRNVDADDV